MAVMAVDQTVALVVVVARAADLEAGLAASLAVEQVEAKGYTLARSRHNPIQTNTLCIRCLNHHRHNCHRLSSEDPCSHRCTQWAWMAVGTDAVAEPNLRV